MKTRQGFVSNSSSSSFICIDWNPINANNFKVFTPENNLHVFTPDDGKLVVDGYNGVTEKGQL